MRGWRWGRKTKPRVDFCVKCNKERTFLPNLCYDGWSKYVHCSHCGDQAPPKDSKLLNKPTVNQLTGRGHQSKAEASFMALLFHARQAGLVENVRGLDRGDPQETFRLDVYGNGAVEALLGAVEDAAEHGRLLALARDVRRSRSHICSYRSDASWTSLDPAWGTVGEKHVADVKGRREGDAYRRFLLKKNLMLACWGIEVEERSGRGTKLL